MKERDDLEKFVKNPDQALQNVDLPPAERKDMILWYVDQAETLTDLDLSRQVDICELSSLLNQEKLKHLESITFNQCNLSEFPDTRHFGKLKKIRIDDNNIHEIQSDKLPESLEWISVAGNTIRTIKINLSKLQKLKYIKCGSDHTKFISFNLIQAKLATKIDIEIDQKYQSNLLLPLHKTLASKNTDLLEEYFYNPEISLKYVNDVKEKKDALEWILEEEKKKFDRAFNLSDQEDLCTLLGLEKLEEYLQEPELCSIKELHLNNCGLTKIPNVSDLPHLRELFLRNNKIQQIEIPASVKFSHLTEIDLTGNEIYVLDANLQSMESLQVLKFGSKKTKYVRLSFLKYLVSKNIQILADEGKLIDFPPYNYLQGQEENTVQLEELCKEPEKALSSITGIKSKLAFLVWLLDDNLNRLHSFKLSCQPDILSYDKDRSILHHPNLQAIKELHLNQCDLTKCPKLGPLPNLKSFGHCK